MGLYYIEVDVCYYREANCSILIDFSTFLVLFLLVCLFVCVCVAGYRVLYVQDRCR